jgi:hypothetical protein
VLGLGFRITDVTLTDTQTTVALSGGEIDTSVATESPLVRIQLAFADVNQIKNTPGMLADNTSSARATTLTITDGTVYDTREIAVPASYATARYVMADVTPPEATSYTLDLVSGNITITFTEPVSPGSVGMGGMTFLSGPAGSALTEARRLSGATDSHSVTTENGTVLMVTMGSVDLAYLQVNMNLTTSTSDTWLAINRSSVADMAAVPNQIVQVTDTSPRQATDYRYYNPATLQLVGPSRGNANGGTHVILTGTGFTQAALRADSRDSSPLSISVNFLAYRPQTSLFSTTPISAFATPARLLPAPALSRLRSLLTPRFAPALLRPSLTCCRRPSMTSFPGPAAFAVGRG